MFKITLINFLKNYLKSSERDSNVYNFILSYIKTTQYCINYISGLLYGYNDFTIKPLYNTGDLIIDPITYYIYISTIDNNTNTSNIGGDGWKLVLKNNIGINNLIKIEETIQFTYILRKNFNNQSISVVKNLSLQSNLLIGLTKSFTRSRIGLTDNSGSSNYIKLNSPTSINTQTYNLTLYIPVNLPQKTIQSIILFFESIKPYQLTYKIIYT